jgi:CBS domain-containing protein
MSRLQQASLSLDATLGDALALFSQRKAGQRKTTCIMVVGPTSELCGLLTETDVLRAACSDKSGGDVAHVLIASFVKPLDDLVLLTTQQFVASASADISCLMATKRIKHLPVVDPDTLAPQGVFDSVLAASDLSATLKARTGVVRVRQGANPFTPPGSLRAGRLGCQAPRA